MHWYTSNLNFQKMCSILKNTKKSGSSNQKVGFQLHFKRIQNETKRNKLNWMQSQSQGGQIFLIQFQQCELLNEEQKRQEKEREIAIDWQHNSLKENALRSPF